MTLSLSLISSFLCHRQRTCPETLNKKRMNIITAFLQKSMGKILLFSFVENSSDVCFREKWWNFYPVIVSHSCDILEEKEMAGVKHGSTAHSCTTFFSSSEEIVARGWHAKTITALEIGPLVSLHRLKYAVESHHNISDMAKNRAHRLQCKIDPLHFFHPEVSTRLERCTETYFLAAVE